MAEIVSLSSVSLDNAVRKIHAKFAEAIDNEKKAYRARIVVGQMLIELRGRIEAGEAGAIEWWDWYDNQFVRSRRDAERCMKIAASEDPEAAEAEARERNREGVQKHRQQRSHSETPAEVASPNTAMHATYVSRKIEQPEQDIIEEALQIVAAMTDVQRQTFFARLEEDYKW